MSKKVLVAYASVSGSTGEVAEAIGSVLARHGMQVEVQHIRNVDSVAGYGAVVLGSSIRAGRWLPEAFSFLEDNVEIMAQIPVAYFTTCLTMVNADEDDRHTVLAYMEPVQQVAPAIDPGSAGPICRVVRPQPAAIVCHQSHHCATGRLSGLGANCSVGRRNCPQVAFRNIRNCRSFYLARCFPGRY